MKRLNILYIQKPGEDPIWDNSLLAAVGAEHDVSFLDREKPIEPQFHGVDGVVMMGAEPTPAEWFEAARGTKFWQLLSVGYDKFDLETIREIGIPCCHCPGSTSSPGLAESAIMMIYLILKRWNEAQEVLAQGKAFNPMGEDVDGRLMGFVGFGASGRETASLAKAVGLRIAIAEPLDIDPVTRDEYQPEFVVKPDAEGMARIFSESDIVSLHLPLTPETHGCITAELLGRMKPTAIFINVARGDLVDQEALYTALLENRIAGIGTDVHAGVFPDPKHPVYQHRNFYATPHTSGTTRGTARRRAQIALENANRVAAGEPLQHRIDL